MILLAPGLAYVLRHERVVPAQAHTAFRETLRVVFVSLACITVTGIVLATLRRAMPTRTVNVGRLIADPSNYLRVHHVEVIWWVLAALVFATLLGAIAADPRLIRLSRRILRSRTVSALSGHDRSAIDTGSAWYKLVHEYDGKANQGPIYVGAQLDDGSYVMGKLWSFNADATEDDKRSLVMSAPITIVPPSKGPIELDFQYSVVSAGRIVRLDVSHLLLEPPADVLPDGEQKSSG